MGTEGGMARDRSALERALDETLAGLPAGDGGAAREGVDWEWLGTGLKLGLERPEQARYLLELIADRDRDRGPAVDLAAEGRDGTPAIPVLSSVLARSAAMPPFERAEAGPVVTFGWASGLTPGEILAVGQVVIEMLAAGAPPDTGRGFGVAWDDGVRIPRRERDAMLREFTDLEIAVASVLAGRDLRADEPPPPPSGLGGLFSQLVSPRDRGQSQAAEAINRSGEPGRRGLVALWNAWVAMRYRALIPSPVFELLVRPWVTVVGPLPEP